MTSTSTGWTMALLILLGVIAVLVIAGMIYGRRQAAERHRAEEAAEQRAEEAGVDLPPAPDAVVVETDAEPVAKEPEPDLPVKAEPAPKPAPEPRPAPAPKPAPKPSPAPAPKPAPAPPAAPEPAPAPAPPPPKSELVPEPTEVAPPPPAPAPEPAPAPIDVAPPPPPPAPSPNLAGALALTTIKGLGPKVAAMLAERGITQVDQLAALTPDQARDLDVQLGAFTGRMARDRWIDQATLLASGDTAAYEAEFGKLG
jgi:predicted flap endonuclease-1-like 5' DNA nuclease